MQIERELMRSCLLEALRRNPRTQYENLKYEVATVAAERGLAIQVAANRQPTLPQADFRRLRETISSLITEGVMTAGMDDSNPAWPFVSLTEYGEEFVLNQRATPHDRAEYLDRLRNAGALDDIEERYVLQSLEAYIRNLPDASAVMLGAASEHLLGSLLEEIASKDPAAQSKAQKALNGPALGMLKFSRDYFLGQQASLPRDLRESLENTFLGIAGLIRATRNDAGHPALPSVDRERAFVNLQLFPDYRAWVVTAKGLLPL